MSRNALIVLNYNDFDTTIHFLQMASERSTIDNIVVVDNCSTDGSYERLKKYESNKIDIIQTEYNGGYSYGNNYGCKYAIDKYSPEYMFISNPDVYFEDYIINDLQKIMATNEDIGVVAPIVNQGYNIWKVPDFVGLIESIFMIWFSCHKKLIKNRLLKSKKEYEIVGVVEGSFWGVKVQAYVDSGGMDERTFLYCEEIMFAKRLQDIGYKTAVGVNCYYDHYHSVSIKKSYGTKRRAYKIFHSSMLVYLNDYIGSNFCKRCIFEIAYFLGYVERCVYDILMYIRNNLRE